MSPGFIWSEIKELWDMGPREYLSDMWNVLDFITNSLYIATIALRLRAYHDVRDWTQGVEILFRGQSSNHIYHKGSPVQMELFGRPN